MKKFYIGLVLTLVFLLLPSCSRPSSNTLYDYSQLYGYKNVALDDSSKLAELASLLQYGRMLPVDDMGYTPKYKELKINFRMNLSEGESYHVDQTKWMQDEILLFALLPGIDSVQFNLVQADYSYGGVSISRKEAQTALDGDIDRLAKTKKSFCSALPKKVRMVSYDPDIMSDIPYTTVMGLDGV